MLRSEIIKKIEDFVNLQPRSVQEIAFYINKNWRTVDRYIEEIKENFGTISTKVFREGTRGALKIVYFSAIDKISSSVFQEKLEHDILKGKTKYEFSPFDIFQHINDNNKKATIENAFDENSTDLEEFVKIIEKTQTNLLIFSGNLSFINLKNENFNIFNEFEKLIRKNINIKIISRIDIAGKENIEKILSLNFKHGKELIEIRHREHPLRAIIIDNKIIRMKEIKESTGKENELNKKIYIFYTFKDKEWAEWLSRIFWKMFSSSIDVNKRLAEMNKIIY